MLTCASLFLSYCTLLKYDFGSVSNYDFVFVFLTHTWYLRGFQKQPPEVFCKKGVLGNFTKFTGKHLCQSLFLNKVAGLMPENI